MQQLSLWLQVENRSILSEIMIPFLDLKRQYAPIRSDIDASIKQVLDHTDFILGKSVAAFEEKFADYCGSRFCIAVNSGTSALHLGLLSVGVRPGDEVITSPSTFVATVAAIDYVGAKAVMVDIDPDSYTIDVEKIEAAITKKTKAIIPVHLYGQSANIDPIVVLAKKYGLAVVEDAAQAHGARYRGRRVGTYGDVGCFSFYPGKNLGAAGEGGAIITDDPELDRIIRMYRDWGQAEKYHHLLKGFNYRMDSIQGAVLGVKLSYLDEWTALRRLHAQRYIEGLSACDAIVCPAEMSWGEHVYHVFAIQVNSRDSIRTFLYNAGVESGIHYPVPVHLQPAYADLGYQIGDFPHSERLAARTLSLPMFAELTDREVDQVITAVLQNVSK